MKRKTFVNLVVVILINLILVTNVFASYPDSITDSIQREDLGEMENKMDPDAGTDLIEKGEATAHPATSSGGGSSSYSTRDESSSTELTNSSSGGLAGALAGVINIFPTAISAVVTRLIKVQEPAGSTMTEFTIQDLVFNKYKLFNINIFDLGNDKTNANYKIKESVIKWYGATRNLGITLSLLVLIYIGIRMAISTVASDKIKYKKMLIDWMTSFVLIFIMQYLLVFAMETSEGILEIIPEQSENLENAIIKGDGNLTSKSIQTKMQQNKGWNFATTCILYWMLVYYQLKFAMLYLKRLFSTSLLILIGPLVTLTYAIDKVGDNKAQGYSRWLKELLVNIYIQPLHAMLYVVFIGSAGEIAKYAPVFAILFLSALSRGEKIVKNVFNLRGLNSINSIGTQKLPSAK